MKWHKITEKLAPINKAVFIFSKNEDAIRYAMLRIYEPETSKIVVHNDCLKSGDVYWGGSMLPEMDLWFHPKKYPYWLTRGELVKLIAGKKEEINRFEILDLRKEE